MNVDDQSRVANNLRVLRHMYGYTQAQVAEKLHMCRCTYNLYESAKQLPGADVFLELAKLYRVRVDTILQEDCDRFTSELIFSEKCKRQVFILIDTYHKLSPYSQGCLLERANVLLDKERAGMLPNYNSPA